MEPKSTQNLMSEAIEIASSQLDSNQLDPGQLSFLEEVGSSPKGIVAPQEVQQLYRQFRQAALESQAHELQKKSQSYVDNFVEPSNLLEERYPSADPNRFDANLSSISQIEFLGLRFHRMSQEKAVETILALTKADRTYRIYFANAHSFEVASRNPDLFKVLKRCNLLLADGSGVLLGSRLTGKSLTYNLNGTDLIPAVFQKASQESPLSVYFLGAKPGVAQKAADNLAQRYLGLRVAGVRDGYFSDNELPVVLKSIREAKPDILLVAMGTPLQEIWIDRNASQLPGIVCIAVGGLFDFMAGCIPRAPKLIRIMGMEWTWRLIMEPSRLWKRYTVGNLIYFQVLARSWCQDIINMLILAVKSAGAKM